MRVETTYPSHLPRRLAASVLFPLRRRAALTSNGAQELLFLVLVLGGFALLVLRPQRARARGLREVRQQLAPGREVMTSAGLFARVVEVQPVGTTAPGMFGSTGRSGASRRSGAAAAAAADDIVLLEISPGVHVRFDARAVVRVLDPPDPTATGSDEPAS